MCMCGIARVNKTALAAATKQRLLLVVRETLKRTDVRAFLLSDFQVINLKYKIHGLSVIF